MKERYYLDLSRVPVFIGKNGIMKKEFEKKFNSKIEVNSKSGEVVVDSDNAVSSFVLSNIISAINYGHSPEHAMNLEDENNVLDIIDIGSTVKNKEKLKSVIGRVIGKDGSTRKTIEEITKCYVSVKDHFVSVIGNFENTMLVHEALDMLIRGASHKSFYSYLERNKINPKNNLI